jgi:hypothetical protein
MIEAFERIRAVTVREWFGSQQWNDERLSTCSVRRS